MKRKVLLIEPNYKNKYPPIGLMKLATYHRMLGDEVRFYKGDLKKLVINEIYSDLLSKLNEIENNIQWEKYYNELFEYIKRGSVRILEQLVMLSENNKPLILQCLKYYFKYYRTGEYKKNPKWDRVCITTLFTFHWKVTIDTINFAKFLVKDLNELKIGGILATVLHDEVEKETGIKPFLGLLNKPGIFDDNNITIDSLPLDYSILDEIDYKYPENNAYYAYMTRGCVRKCEFCVVWKLEPKFEKYIPLKNKINDINNAFGEKRNLLLLDNNVLASNKFPDIINEIKKNGFVKGATFTDPDYLEIVIRNLKKDINEYGNIRKANEIINSLLKKARGKDKQHIYDILEEKSLLNLYSSKKENIISAYKELSGYYQKYRNKSSKLRYVDFNQGLDARFMTEKKMKLLSEIPIKPLRIAFDSMGFLKEYELSVRWASKYKIPELSNYLLYNYEDKPEELYQRLSLNVNFCEELNMDIYSFPMKYLPLDMDKFYMNRNYVGKYWNRKFLRAVQAILNSTKGKIGEGKSFFEKAFGKNLDEYYKLLYMPETYLIYRLLFEKLGYSQEWEELIYKKLNEQERKLAFKIIQNNDFKDINYLTTNSNIQKVLFHYTVSRDDVKEHNADFKVLKGKFEDYFETIIT